MKTMYWLIVVAATLSFSMLHFTSPTATAIAGSASAWCEFESCPGGCAMSGFDNNTCGSAGYNYKCMGGMQNPDGSWEWYEGDHTCECSGGSSVCLHP
jgi:hypothetical protein